jgi:hypothetical protein
VVQRQGVDWAERSLGRASGGAGMEMGRGRWRAGWVVAGNGRGPGGRQRVYICFLVMKVKFFQWVDNDGNGKSSPMYMGEVGLLYI